MMTLKYYPLVVAVLLGPFLFHVSTAYGARTINVLGLRGDLGRALEAGAGVYLVTVDKTQDTNPAPSGAVSGNVMLRVDTVFCGRETKTLLLPFSTKAPFAKSNNFAVWPKVPMPQEQFLVVVVPNGTDGNITPALPDGAASQAWEVKAADDAHVKLIKQVLELWSEKDVDAQIKACEAALASLDPLVRHLAMNVLCHKDLAKRPKETLQVLDRELVLVKEGKTKLDFNAAITLFASIQGVVNSPKVEQENKDTALRTLVGFVLVPDSQISEWALGFLATTVEQGTVKGTSTALLGKEEVASLQDVINKYLRPGSHVLAHAAAEKVAGWAGVSVGH